MMIYKLGYNIIFIYINKVTYQKLFNLAKCNNIILRHQKVVIFIICINQ